MRPSHQPAPALLKRVRELAACNLLSSREQRYDGSGFDVTLDQFHPDDVTYLREVYDTVKKTYELWLYMRESPNHVLMARHLRQQFTGPKFHEATRALGGATYRRAEAPPPMLRKVLHDVRGGALVGLAGYASLLTDIDPSDAEYREWVEIAALMSRDHAKLMRNAIPDIDPLVREADEGLKVHYIDDFAHKWHGARLQHDERRAQVTVHCDYHGSITNRCLETSAIDRVLYNFLNNATRFTADGNVTLVITAINPQLVRWATVNRLTVDQQQWLQERFAADLRPLFAGGHTRGGQGIGLSNCADFVAATCGFTPRTAIDDGYLGARMIEDEFYAWFHWPSYDASDGQVPDCAC